MIQIQIKLFGGFRKYENGNDLFLLLKEESSIAEIREVFIERMKIENSNFNETALVFDSVFANEENILMDTDKISQSTILAILPPVCGG